MIYIAIGVALIAIMTIIGGGVFLRVLEINIEGSNRYTDDEILAVSGLEFGDNLLFMNGDRISSNIREAKPFVIDVSVTRMPPSGVLIEIYESNALARVLFEGEIYIIDSSGRVLEVVGAGQANIASLIEVRGVNPENPAPGNILRSSRLDADTRIQAMKEVLSLLEQEDFYHNITYIDVSNITNIHLGYEDIYRVIFGGLSNVRVNMSRLESAINDARLLNPNVSGDINMTNPDSPPRFIAN